MSVRSRLFIVPLLAAMTAGGADFKADFNRTFDGTAGKTIVRAEGLEGTPAWGKDSVGDWAEPAPASSLCWPLAADYYDINSGTLSFFLRPVGWGNGAKYTGKSHFVPLALFASSKYNWEMLVYAAWNVKQVMKIQVQTKNCRGGRSIHFQSLVPKHLFKPDRWSLLTLTWSNMDMTFYVDGVKIGTADFGLPMEKRIPEDFKLHILPRAFWKNPDLPRYRIAGLELVKRVLSSTEISRRMLEFKAAGQTTPRFALPAPKASVPVKIDGLIDPAEWRDATAVPIGVMNGSGLFNSEAAGVLYLKHDGKNLLYALRIPGRKIEKAPGTGDLGRNAFSGSVLDFWWKLSGEPAFACRQLGIAPDDAWGYRGASGKWTSLKFRSAARTLPDGWSAECALPLKTLGAAPGTAFDAGFCVRCPDIPHDDNCWLTLGSPRPRKSIVENLGVITLREDSRNLRLEGLRGLNYGKIDLTLTAPEGTRYELGSSESGKPETAGVCGAAPVARQGRTGQGLGLLSVRGRDETLVLRYAVADPFSFTTRCFPSKRQLRIKLDMRGLDLNAGGAGKITCTGELLSRNGGSFGRAVLPVTAPEMTIILPFRPLAPGDYTLRLTLEGKTLKLSRERRFTRPSEAFLDAGSGMTRNIPHPFEPLKSGPEKLETATVRYTFPPRSPFPVQAENQGEALLAAPVTFYLAVDGKKEQLRPAEYAVKESAPDRQIASGVLRTPSGKIAVRWTRRADYDGMLKYDFRLIPLKGPVEVSRFGVWTAVKKDASLYSLSPIYRPEWKEKGKCAAFPIAWLTGNRHGFSLFTDNDCNWVWKGKDPLRMERRKDGSAALSAALIEKPVEIREAVPYVLAMMATPSKQPRPDWRTIHTQGWGQLKGQNLQILGGINSKPRFWRAQDLSQPLDDNIREWFEILRNRPAKVTRTVPYIYIGALSDNTPAADYYDADWERTVDGARQAKSNEATDVLDNRRYALLGLHLCFNRRGPADFLAYHFERLLEKYPGFVGLYLDMGGYAPTDTPYPGHSLKPVLATGRKVRNYDLFGRRDAMERFSKIIRKHRGPEGILFNHNWDNYPPCLSSFCDLLFPGEEYMHVIRKGMHVYIEETPLEKWQSNYRTEVHGTAVAFTGQWRILGGNLNRLPEKERREYTKPLLMMCLLHGTSLDGSWYPAVEGVWKLLDDLKICDADFTGYWMPGACRSDDDKVKVSFYAWRGRPGERLFMLGNLSREPRKLKLPLPGAGSLTDACTGKKLDPAAPVELEGNFGFRILRFLPAARK